MGKNQHTIYGINGSAAILSSKDYKIIDIFIQSGSPAERDGSITRALGQHGGHIKFIKPTHFKSKYNDEMKTGILIEIEQYLGSIC